ncbi:ricin-type beta-trefoil lectin domain protein [Peterkaempfera sp. SMS 1(5)a]|uniref:ricin-type beta-trefoil lectin domain protein n=1 Tax=Peterkaempfera podocarpi TaxID=3232308 RepID=UPI0036707A66
MLTTLALIAGLGLAGVVASAPAAQAAGSVVAYPLLNVDRYSNYTASPAPDANLSMTVGGTPVAVQDNLGSAQTRFAASGPQTVVITDTAGVTSAAIRPLAFGMQPVVSGNTITFTLPQPENFAVDINGVKDALLVFADPLESNPPQLSDSNVVNVTGFSGVNTTGATETAALQAAIDYVSAHSSTTPILYFPPGVYRTALLTVGSNVQLYLSSGAVLLADGTEADYTQLPGTVGYPSSAVLAARGASNVKIFGRGVVDGNGYNLQTSYGPVMGIFDLFTDGGTSNLTVNDVMFTNSVMWQTSIQGSHDLAFTNVKFNNPQGNIGNQDDAFKINGCSNVTFTGGWLSSRDDSITFAAVSSEAIYNTSNINMSGTVVDSSGTASAIIRFADLGSGKTMTGMNVSNIYDISYGRGMELRGDGGNAAYQNSWGSGTVINNWDVENPAPLVYFGSSGSANVTISGITISNMNMAAGSSGGRILGDSTNAWNNIHFSNITIGGAVASDFSSLELTTNSYATHVDVAADSANTDLAIPTTSRPSTTTTTNIASGYTASSATDGNFGTFFKSTQSATFPQNLAVTWPAPHAVSGVTIVCDYCQGQAPTGWSVQVSADGSTNWTTVATSGVVSWQHDDNSNESRLVSFPAQTVQGVRVQIGSANNQFGQYQIDEMEVTPANSAPAATATTTSLASGSSASAANSGLWESFFKSASSPSFPQFYTLQWPQPQTVGAVTLVCDYCQGQAPTNWDIQQSMNGTSNWTTVASSGTVSWPAPNDATRHEYTVSFTPVTAAALRLKINNANLAYGAYQIDQVETMPAKPVSTQSYINSASGLCLDDPNGSTTPGTFADIAGCSGAAQQQFTYTPASETLTAQGLCLDSYGGGSTPGTKVDLYTCLGAGNPSQVWTLNSSGQIVSGESGLCVQENGTASGSQLALQTCDTTNTAQAWAVQTVRAYKNGASGLCLDDPNGSTTAGVFADVEGCSGAAQQQFTSNSLTGALSTEGLCADSYGGGSSPGTKVDLYLCQTGFPSRQWTVTPGGQIVSGESGLCVQEAGTASGSQIELEYCDIGNPAQIWTAM